MEKVLIYPNWFNDGAKVKVLKKILANGIASNYDFIVNSKSVDNVDRDFIEKKFIEFKMKYNDKEIVFVAVGYSPLVAVAYDIAKDMGIKSVYYITDKDKNIIIEKTLD